MSRLGLRAVSLLALSLVAMIPAFGLPTFDAVADFSSSNPSVAWSYGWVPAGSTDTNSFELFDSYQVLVPGVNAWTYVAADPPPIIAQNTGPDDVTYVGGYLDGIVQPWYLLLLHPGTEGEYAVLRWTAPADAVYNVNAYFQNIDQQAVTVDVAIDGALLGPFTIDDYGSNFFVTGPQYFTAGQTLDFIVQTGGVGVAANFAVPEPATLSLLGMGLLALGILRRRS
jgi:hypothetical protein